MPGGDTLTFTITSSDTIRTASGSGRAYVYEGTALHRVLLPEPGPLHHDVHRNRLNRTAYSSSFSAVTRATAATV